MIIKLKFIYVIIIILTFSCSKKTEQVTTLKEKNLESQMIEVYNQGMKNLKRDVIYAGKNLVKQNYYFRNLFGLKSNFNVCLWLFFSRIL